MTHLDATTRQSKTANILVSRRLALMVLGALRLTVLLTPAAHAQQTVGHVIEIEGNWILNEGRSVEKWEGVPAGGVIRISSPGNHDRITIVSGNRVIASRICTQPDSCNDPIILPRSEPAASPLVATIWDWMNNKLFGSQERYVPQRARGDGNLLDAVVLLKDGQLDLRTMFHDMPKGAYNIVIRTLPKEGSRKRLGPIPIAWNPDDPAPVSVPPVLTPGLYQFDLPGDTYASGSDAWALVSAPGDYNKVAGSFAEAREVTKKWGDPVEPKSISSFLRASLEYLATQEAR
jgi:hypothetical protein